MSLYDRLFRFPTGPYAEPATVEDAAPDPRPVAQEDLAWADSPAHARFLDWLDQEIDRPIGVGGHMEMVQSAVRSNTLKEVREHLRRQRSAAVRLLKESHDDV